MKNAFKKIAAPFCGDKQTQKQTMKTVKSREEKYSVEIEEFAQRSMRTFVINHSIDCVQWMELVKRTQTIDVKRCCMK